MMKSFKRNHRLSVGRYDKVVKVIKPKKWWRLVRRGAGFTYEECLVCWSL